MLIPKFVYPKTKRRELRIAQAFAFENFENTYLNMRAYFPTEKIKKAPQAHVFPSKKGFQLPPSFMANKQSVVTQPFMNYTATQGLLVIQKGMIIYENYFRGQAEHLPHIAWSVTKSMVSALFGIAMEEGYIHHLEQKVEEYLPELKGSAYEGVRLKDVLQMSSGVRFDETQGDPNSDISRWWQSFINGESQDEFAASLKREFEPGTYHHYVSIDSHVLGMLIVRATGKSLSAYFQEKIWGAIGAEYNAYWVLDNRGMEMALGGLCACLRDYGRFGQLFLNQGRWEGKQIIPMPWVKKSTLPDADHLQAFSPQSAHPGVAYGYQWWVPHGEQGEFLAMGVYDQYIYVNPTTQTVIVKNSANPNYTSISSPSASYFTHLEFFRAIAQQAANFRTGGLSHLGIGF